MENQEMNNDKAISNATATAHVACEVDENGKPITADDPTGRPWQWKEGRFTVTRSNARTAPGCHDNCGVLLYVDENGKLDHVEGDPENPYNQGRLCLRCLCVPDQIYHPDRIVYPMKRAKEDRGRNKWERISWDEAFDLCEKEIKAIQAKYGPESVYVACGTGRDVILYENILKELLGTPNSGMAFFPGQSCYLPRTFSTNLKGGALFISDYSQFFHDRYDHEGWIPPEYIVVWGNNPVVANSDGSLGHWIVECMKRGSKLITIDPKLTWCSAHSEYWLPVRPGTDSALALAIGHVIVEEDLYDHDFVSCWTYGFEAYSESVKEWTPERVAEICEIDVDLIYSVARALGKSECWTLQWGVALDHTSEGFYTGMAAYDLVGLTGMFDHPGGMMASLAPFNCGIGWMPAAEDMAWIPKDPNMRPPITKPELKGLNAMGMADSTTILEGMENNDDYSIKCVWFYATNPITNEGVRPDRVVKVLQEASEFNVIQDMWMTPTAMACGDLFLPIATYPERIGIAGHQPYLTGAINQVIEREGECKSDNEIVVEIGRRWRGEDICPWKTDEEYYDFLLANCGSGWTYKELRERTWALPKIEYFRYKSGKLRADGGLGFNTVTGRYEFTPVPLMRMGIDSVATFEEPPESPVSTPELAAEYPLILTTGARNWGFFHSEGRQIPHLRAIHPEPTVRINPADAAKYGIEDGDWVLIENNHGSCRQKAEVTVRIKEGVVSADHGWWFPERKEDDGTFFGVMECNINKLLSTKPGKVGLGNSYKSCLCRISKWEEQ